MNNNKLKMFQKLFLHLTSDENYVLGSPDGDYLLGDWHANNIIIAGEGEDHVSIYPRSDDKAGHNIILGQGGPDVLRGANNSDLVVGGRAGDVIQDSDGRDLVLGGPGVDHIDCGDGDLVFGGPGDDRIRSSGDGARVRAYGGNGNDFFEGPGMIAEGGRGSDTFFASDKMVITDYSARDILDFEATGALLDDLVIKADKHGNTLIKYPFGGDEPRLETMKLLGVAPEEINFDNVRIAAGDDFAGDASTTGVLPIDGKPVYGVAESPFDHDWFRIELEGFDNFADAVPVEIRVEGITGWDPHSAIRDADGNVVARAENWQFDDHYVVASEEGGTYYVDVGDFDEPGTYSVTASIYDGPQIIWVI